MELHGTVRPKTTHHAHSNITVSNNSLANDDSSSNGAETHQTASNPLKNGTLTQGNKQKKAIGNETGP